MTMISNLGLTGTLNRSESREATGIRSSIVLLGRFLFSGIFLLTVASHFTGKAVGYAAAAGVPFPQIAVPLSGVVAIVGALSIVFGYKARLGAWLLVLFLVPVTFTMHKFWGIADPMMAQMQMAHFMKNMALIGGALLISQFGTGPLSLDSRNTNSRS
jgi:putative oxidoreductase